MCALGVKQKTARLAAPAASITIAATPLHQQWKQVIPFHVCMARERVLREAHWGVHKVQVRPVCLRSVGVFARKLGFEFREELLVLGQNPLHVETLAQSTGRLVRGIIEGKHTRKFSHTKRNLRGHFCLILLPQCWRLFAGLGRRHKHLAWQRITSPWQRYITVRITMATALNAMRGAVVRLVTSSTTTKSTTGRRSDNVSTPFGKRSRLCVARAEYLTVGHAIEKNSQHRMLTTGSRGRPRASKTNLGRPCTRPFLLNRCSLLLRLLLRRK
eukprot:m.924749 g.924749  ORF g.924749 m.924749 type:complete len:272 (-) comp23771_c0_seq3:2329-3144(-)